MTERFTPEDSKSKRMRVI